MLSLACQKQPAIDLTIESEMLVLPEIDDQFSEFSSISQHQDFQTFAKLPEQDQYNKAWIRWNIGDISTMERPVLMLGLCRTIDRVYWGETLLVDFNLKNLYNYDSNLSRHPLLMLPTNPSSQTLWLHVLRSKRTGFRPDCRELIITSEINAVRRYLSFQAIDTLTGIILLFLALLAFTAYLLKRQIILVSFSLFCVAMGGTVFTLSQPVHFAFANAPWMMYLSSSLFLLVPPIFLIFFYQILPERLPVLRWMAALNSIPLPLNWYFILTGQLLESSQLRQLFFQCLGPQIGLAVVLSMRCLIQSPYPASILAQGFGILFLGSCIDILTLTLGLPFFQATSIALIIFMGFLLTYLLQLFIDKEKHLEQERGENMQEYSSKLAKEVESRSLVLNEKTEELEQSNHDLEEKNILLSNSHKRLEDLIGQKDSLLKKVAEIEQILLPEIFVSLNQYHQDHTKHKLQNLSIEIHKISSQLEPVGRLHGDVEALKSRTIWLLEPVKQLLMVTKMALGGSRVEIRSFLSPEEFTHSIATQRPDLAVISGEFPTISQLLHIRYPEVAVVLTSRVELSQHIALLSENPRLCHVIHQGDEDRAFSQKNLLVTVTKILSNDIFGLEKYLNWGVDVKEHIITASTDRTHFLELMEAELTKAGVLTSHIRNATLITDELLMNAIYDAPVNRKTGEPKYNHLSRRIMVELEPTEYGKLRFAFDGTMIAISVDDPFGALKRETITRYLKSCFEGHFGKINEHEGKGGGGMGLFQIISTADLMITNINPGEKTEIVALINASGRVQTRRGYSSFHYFVER